MLKLYTNLGRIEVFTIESFKREHIGLSIYLKMLTNLYKYIIIAIVLNLLWFLVSVWYVFQHTFFLYMFVRLTFTLKHLIFGGDRK